MKSIETKPGGQSETTRNAVRMWLIIVIGVLAVGSVVMIALGKRPEKLPEAPDVSVAVSVISVSRSDVAEHVIYAGRVEADPSVALAFDIGGSVMEIARDKGTAVRKGETILKMDDRLQTAAAQRALAAYEVARDDFKRIDGLKAEGAVSESDHQSAKARETAASATLAEARTYVSKCELVSPIDGTVEDRMIEIGEYAAPGVPVCRVGNLAVVKIGIHMSERDAFALKTGQDVSFAVDSIPAGTFAGKVRFVAPSSDQKSGTFPAEIVAENRDGTLKPGLIAKVDLVSRTLKDCIAIPARAMIPLKGEYVVYIVKDGCAVRRVAKLEAIVGETAVVKEGLNAGETLIVDGNRQVLDGIKVTVMQGKADGNGDTAESKSK